MQASLQDCTLSDFISSGANPEVGLLICFLSSEEPPHCCPRRYHGFHAYFPSPWRPAVLICLVALQPGWPCPATVCPPPITPTVPAAAQPCHCPAPSGPPAFLCTWERVGSKQHALVCLRGLASETAVCQDLPGDVTFQTSSLQFRNFAKSKPHPGTLIGEVRF